jgi:glycosyltransferase involved in cell wall biosynthesis
MRVAAVFEGIPHSRHGGGNLVALAMVFALRQRGLDVHCISLPAQSGLGDPLEAKIKNLKDEGIPVHLLNAEDASSSASHRAFNRMERVLRRLFILPRTRDIFVGANYQAQLRDLLAEIRPDAIVGYHWNALAAIEGTKDIPVLGIVSDPIHQPDEFRRSFLSRYGSRKQAPSLKGLLDLLYPSNARKVMARLLNACTKSGGFAAHDVEFFQSAGAASCRYYRAPIFDPFPHGFRAVEKPGPFKILHIGHMQGIATLSGLESLANTILPRLRAELPPRSFEIHLVGGYFDRMPEGLRSALSVPEVVVRGHVESADPEFKSAHVVLVPTPIRLGMRVRILTAFSFGNCVVAHEANSAGIPELVHSANSLLGSDGVALAQHCVALFHDAPRRRRLEERARQTYEEWFSLESAGGRIVADLTAIAQIDATTGIDGSMTGRGTCAERVFRQGPMDPYVNP